MAIRSLMTLCACAAGYSQAPPAQDLTGLPFEDLMNIKVSSVSKRQQNLSRTAAAVFVITSEDIRHSGASSIPDLLRMVPGLDVARINQGTWAITSRGFNGQFSNKILVLIDGRTVYDPSFSGVYWDVQDYVLEDIDRIEVIRGPGATIWGSNAVNGVVNITTKAARDTSGALVSMDAGSDERGGSVRYGGTLGGSASYRVFGKYYGRDSSSDFSPQHLSDSTHLSHAGFRLDWEPGRRDSFTFEGDGYSGITDNPFRAPPALLGAPIPHVAATQTGGGDFLAKWTHTFAGGSQFTVQAYADRLTRVDATDPELRTTADFEARDHIHMGRHEIVWGFGYRHNWDRITGSPQTHFTPSKWQGSLVNGFFQDEITLAENKLWLTLGGKLEHNDFTGLETEPAASLIWVPAERHSVWISASGASKIPARNDTDIFYGVTSFPTPQGFPALIAGIGNPQFQSEKVVTYQAGYRVEPVRWLWLDLTGFRNDYRDLRTIESVTPSFVPGASPYLLMPLIYRNGEFGRTYGAEAFLEWKALENWTLSGGYTWFLPALRIQPSSTDSVTLPENQGNAPRNQMQVRSRASLPKRIEWDTAIYRVGRLGTGNIPAYTRLDVRIGWRASSHIELSVGGRNLLSPAHMEFDETEQKVLSAPVERNFYCSVTWRF